jgi:hypothetical protein
MALTQSTGAAQPPGPLPAGFHALTRLTERRRLKPDTPGVCGGKNRAANVAT